MDGAETAPSQITSETDAWAVFDACSRQHKGLVVVAVFSLLLASTARGEEDTLQFLTSGIESTKAFDAVDSDDCCQDGCCCRPWGIRGWLDGGLIGNTSSPTSKFNGPYNAVDRSNEAMFNQGYLIVERFIPTDGSWGTGGRLDLLYGEDFFLAQSAGFELRPNGGHPLESAVLRPCHSAGLR